MNLRRTPITIAAVGAAAALAFTAPVVAKAAFDAQNAHKVDGLHADQLTKTQYFQAATTFDNFDSCPFTPVLTRTFKTTHRGVVAVTSQVSAARDVSDPDEAVLSTRVTIDGVVASQDSAANLEDGGTTDATVVGVAARKVGAGAHTIVIQASECTTGMAFIHHESMLVSYSPFGKAASLVTIKPTTQSAGANR